MPRTPGRTPLYDVPAPDADAVLQEIAIRYKAGKTIARQTFDPALGSTYEEAERALSEMRTDVGKYSKYVFGIEPARVHRLWNNAMDDVIQRRCRQNKLLIIAPPNSAKSTYASIVRPAYYLGQNPDHHLLFFTSSDEMSKTFGSTVRLALEQNERHRSVFSENLCRPDRKRGWSSDGLYLKGTPPAAKDPAYKSVGFNATVMGARAHGIILDDVMDQKDAVSDIEQQKAKNYYTQTIRPRLHTSQGWLVAIMTRFHENDLASHFIKLAEESGEWLVIRTPMLAEETGDILGRYPGESLWPEQYTPEFIKATQAGMTIAEFNLVYQGDPTGMGGDIFENESWFQGLPDNFWSDIEPNCRMVQAWDLAWSEKDRTCYTVGMTAAVDAMMNMYVIHVSRGRWSDLNLENEMVRAITLAKPAVVGIEESTFHMKATRALVQRILGRVMCNIQLPHPDKDKVTRARLPAGRAQHGKLFVDKRRPWYRPFIKEMLGFPNTTYKDQVDALSLLTLLVQNLGEDVRMRRNIQHVETAMSA
jgi:predicted phage terminase large subunit-like protein